MKIIECGSKEYEEAVELRACILRKPLKLYFTPEELQEESESFHLAAFKNNKMIACTILQPLPGGKIRLRQMAVAEGVQKMGFGRALVVFAEEIAQKKGFCELVLHAREAASGFYEKLGYKKEGVQFKEVGLPHWRMTKKI